MRKVTGFLAVLMAGEIVAVGALFAACTNGRIGTQTYPFGSADSEVDILIALVRDKCSAEDLQWYRGEAGKVMAAVYLDIEERLWAEHPSLKPREMDGTYTVDPTNFEPRFYAERLEDDK